MPACLKANGMSPEAADALREELMTWIRQNFPAYYSSAEKFDHPLFRITSISTAADKAFSKYIENIARAQAATILQTTPAAVDYVDQYPIVYTNMKKGKKVMPEPQTMDKVMVILALGKLDKGNGLPSFEDSAQNVRGFALESGELLAATLDLAHIFYGTGGGLAHLSLWTRRGATSGTGTTERTDQAYEGLPEAR
ncbi:hypothetical protein H2199_003957 [Coniosporium tulheliwenetii]|uniref:Uncharacterized protein n=1 Tax=Coniosporium tulheliwenetii TaxID=3383036 RepID=A0ACC2Z982_9PEZI|nr:hypothetical protein H2199_003957 [Cladosporium sp. JES 115]